MYDTSIATHNLGDFIINESINHELAELIENNYVVRYGTHTPIAKVYQQILKPNKYIREADYRFLCGTNIFGTNLLRPVPNFNINIFDINLYKNCISIGCGIGRDKGSPEYTVYSKCIYKHILSREYIHSVRDEETVEFLQDLGFQAINTGCPTLWQLDSAHCSRIPKEKSNKVVFTITDYAKNDLADSAMIDQLEANYDEIYMWLQGTGDLQYSKRLLENRKVKIIPPSLEAYRKFLKETDVDYVGTRLHAGIFAMQHMKRTIIISVDHRATKMSETHNIPIIERENIAELDELINTSFETNIIIDSTLINKWKAQFDVK